MYNNIIENTSILQFMTKNNLNFFYNINTLKYLFIL
jgi:hypothetical protein